MAAEAESFLLLNRQIEAIKTLPDRSAAYAALLHLLRRGASNHPPSVEALSRSSAPLLRFLLADIGRRDEETAAYALRCLGFMLYHPSIVETIPEEVAVLALESLVMLITMTKMKAICNLGVWCISLQQIAGSIVEQHLALILKAIMHAIDNPFGSLSTTYEATQVLAKLSTQFCVEMRSMSNIWVPSLYKRLICSNKRERDMAERFFLKIKSIICPPPLVLSTVIVSDLKQKLLPTMMEMLHATKDHRQKILIIQAWGWYICLCGPSAVNDRHLVNKMLKVPEITFADSDIQVQVATLVAWETLIDALLPPVVIHDVIQGGGSAPSFSFSDDKTVGILRRIKVLMVPLHGIISSKLDLPVRSRCLLTWQYLLHKLDLLVNHSSVIETTFWKILEVIFPRGPDDENMYLWNSCIDLLDEFLLAKVKAGETIPVVALDINDMHHQLNMVSSIIHPEQMKTMASDQRTLTLDAALKIFRSIVQGVQSEVQGLPDCSENIKMYITTLHKFRKQVCESVASKNNGNLFNDSSWVHAQFRKVIRDELEP